MSGTERGFACLGHDTISVNLLRPCIKRNQSIDRKIAKEGWSQGKNWTQEQRGGGEKGGCIENEVGGGEESEQSVVHLNVHRAVFFFFLSQGEKRLGVIQGGRVWETKEND